ncbi:uncharacterized protein SPSC_03835 [Sporisorium scitamineum]|uniref:Uncharacterized protein n=1 Tax=Sporisorium scitamineum TaxID=49012 RepID=A0A127Z3A4_9BASI|nr:uncharacterized protein SPSC_03835 [Sporisorium scitamineum]
MVPTTFENIIFKPASVVVTNQFLSYWDSRSSLPSGWPSNRVTMTPTPFEGSTNLPTDDVATVWYLSHWDSRPALPSGWLNNGMASDSHQEVKTESQGRQPKGVVEVAHDQLQLCRAQAGDAWAIQAIENG